MTERDLPEDPQKDPAETVDALEERAAAETATPESEDTAVGEDVRTAADEDEQLDGEPGSSSEPPA